MKNVVYGMDAAPLSMLLVGHSFISRLAEYALVSGTMNLGLDESDCQVAFFGRRGLTLRKLVPLTDEVLSRQPDVVFLEIGCNDIDMVAPVVLAEQVFQFAKMLVARGVRRVSVANFFSGRGSFEVPRGARLQRPCDAIQPANARAHYGVRYR